MKYINKETNEYVKSIKLKNDNDSIASIIELFEDVDMSTSIIGRNSCINDVKRNYGIELRKDFKIKYGQLLVQFPDKHFEIIDEKEFDNKFESIE